MQSALVLELRRSLTSSDTAKDARKLLTQLRGRRDLLARIAEEIDEALGTTLRGRLRTILSTVAITVVGLSLLAFLFGESLVDARLGQLQQRLSQSEQALQGFQKGESERQEEIKRLEQQRQSLATQVNETAKRLKSAGRERQKTEKALEKEKETLQEIQRKRDELQQHVLDLQTRIAASKQNAQGKSNLLDLPKTFKNDIGIEFVLIPKGTFEMGSNDGDSDETPVHQVTINQPFYLAKHEVTQAQWQRVMQSNPSEFKGENLPVTNVSWNDAQKFIEELNARERINTYRLPTEAEWEYAARARTKTAYSFGNDPGLLKKYGWYDDNSDGKIHAVGQLKENPWGLHDMHGNVWEWVEDWYGKYPSGSQSDPEGPKNGNFRVVRGGSFIVSPRDLRSARRDELGPVVRFSSLGFRCVRVAPQS